MTVKRIVANIAADRVEDARDFYAGILGLHVAMDLGWIVTFAADTLRCLRLVSRLRAGQARRFRTFPSKWTI